MDIKTALTTDENLDPYQLYNDTPIEELINQLEKILSDEAELSLLRGAPLYRGNVYKVVNFLYLKFLNEPKEETPKKDKAEHRRPLFKDETLEKLYSLA